MRAALPRAFEQSWLLHIRCLQAPPQPDWHSGCICAAVCHWAGAPAAGLCWLGGHEHVWCSPSMRWQALSPQCCGAMPTCCRLMLCPTTVPPDWWQTGQPVSGCVHCHGAGGWGRPLPPARPDVGCANGMVGAAQSCMRHWRAAARGHKPLPFAGASVHYCMHPKCLHLMHDGMAQLCRHMQHPAHPPPGPALQPTR